MTTINKKDFLFYKIDKEYREDFKQIKDKFLPNFYTAALKWIGEAIRQRESEYFWEGNSFCWFTDKTQQQTERVWITDNAIVVFEDTQGDLYRIEFK